jgi:hypothetical protein
LFITPPVHIEALSTGGLAATKARVISQPSLAPRPLLVKLATAVNCEACDTRGEQWTGGNREGVEVG